MLTLRMIVGRGVCSPENVQEVDLVSRRDAQSPSSVGKLHASDGITQVQTSSLGQSSQIPPSKSHQLKCIEGELGQHTLRDHPQRR